LLAQDVENCEIILVDDGSPDACPQICDSYAAAHDNIRVVHRKNGGLSAARNSGIEVSQGEYLLFVDSDDYIEPNVLKGLMEQVERDNLDVLRYRLQYVRLLKENDGMSREKSLNEPLTLNDVYQVFNPYKSDPFKGNDYSETPTDGVSFLNTRMNTACYAWQFVLKRELLDGCIFTPGIYFEDTDWTPRMLCRAKRVASTDTIVYNYLMREGSITNAVNRSKLKKVLDDKLHLIATLQHQAIDLRKCGRYNRWYKDMISDLVVSIIGMLGVDFYDEKDTYLSQMQRMQIYPLQPKSLKARLINISPLMMVRLLHFKNKK
jgi:glycosyltransferase involved in cell wall biosynthesis